MAAEKPKAEKPKGPSLAQLLQNADANGDQKLDLAEIHAKVPKFPEKRFTTLDKNQDGHLSRSEIPADMPLLRTRMSTYDANQDGSLDAHEFAAAQAALHAGGHAGGSDSTPAPRHSGG